MPEAKENKLVTDINEAWVMARAEKPYRDRIIVCKELSAMALSGIINTGQDWTMSKKQAKKHFGISRKDSLIREWFGWEPSFYTLEPRDNELGSLDVINWVFDQHRKMPAERVYSATKSLSNFFSKFVKVSAKEARKTYRQANQNLNNLNAQN